VDNTTTVSGAPVVTPGRERWLVAGAVALATAVTGGVLAFAYAGGAAYDEGAHRSAVEAELGHEVSDWAAIAQITEDDCGKSDEDLQLRGAVAKDGVIAGSSWDAYDVTVLGLSFRCPDRLGSFVTPPTMP
jgi:hypothetical protein